MQENQLISVIVPVYNVEKYLDECIESIVNQSYSNLEIILVDDGSTDNSGEKCDIWATKDNRIVVIHKSNGGLGNARNVGMSYANGEWIGFVDSDDFIDKKMYEFLYNACTENNADLAVSSFSFFRNGEYQPFHKCTGDVIIYEGLEWIDEYYGNDKSGNIVTAAWCKLYRRDIIIDKKFSEGRYYEDIVVTAKVLNDAKKIVYLDDALYNYRKDRGESITESKLDNKKVDDSIDLNLEEIEFLQSCGYKETAQKLLEQLLFTWANQIGICSIKTMCSQTTLVHMKRREKEIFSILQSQECGMRFACVFAHYLKRVYSVTSKLKRIIQGT